jgi:hypothetical protein
MGFFAAQPTDRTRASGSKRARMHLMNRFFTMDSLTSFLYEFFPALDRFNDIDYHLFLVFVGISDFGTMTD